MPAFVCKARQAECGVRLGIAHHLGWAVAVTASPDYQVVDRRRIELIEPGRPTAPIHHDGGPHLRDRAGRDAAPWLMSSRSAFAEADSAVR